MCLKTVNVEMIRENGILTGIGYKKVKIGEFSGNVIGIDKGMIYVKDKWIKCEKTSKDVIQGTDGQCYIPGFHLFTTIADAKNYVTGYKIGKFQFRRILAVGYNVVNNAPTPALCIVVDEIKFLEIVE